ncbi:MAG TPA: hypothetical protein VGR00_14510 [Thermoanaerobaculia bacterium]|nr:hypothetical protein [Thermoanaerobaculia bacterium]
MRGPSVLLASVLSLFSPRALAQAPLGGEFRANTYTTADQTRPKVAHDSSGNFIVLWESSGGQEPGAMTGVFAQRYASSGTPLGGEMHVNTYTTDEQFLGQASFDSSGNFVIVWRTGLQDGSGAGIFARRYASSGAPLAPEFQVNVFTTGAQGAPFVAHEPNGDFVVVWTSLNQDGGSYGVFGQRFASSGSRLGGEFQVNTFTVGIQLASGLAANTAGDFLVAWTSLNQDGDMYGVYAQRFASNGSTLGGEFRVNTYTTGHQLVPSVGRGANGGFVVAWGSAQEGSSYGIVARRFASDGSPLGAEFLVNTFTTGEQGRVAVASDSSGAFVVAWESANQDSPASRGIYAQRFDPDGTPRGAEFRANTYTTQNQVGPSVSSDPVGNFVISWGSLGPQDGSLYAVISQRYSCPTLTSSTIGVAGSTSVCTGGTGGTATVTDVGGFSATHQWAFRTSVMPMGSYTPIPGETGSTYLVKYSDFPGPGFYFIVCATTPACGSFTFTNEIAVTVSGDAMGPTVSPPAASAVTQTLCQ